MKDKTKIIIQFLISTKMCCALSVLMVLFVAWAISISNDSSYRLMQIRFSFVLILSLIALLSLMCDKKPLFIKCIAAGILCLFLYQIWMLCNYIWISSEEQAYAIETLSTVGFYLFLFTASYGALDSLADDGSRENRRYRMMGAGAAIVVTAVWLVRFSQTHSIHIPAVGVALSLLAYISFKQMVIPDIDNGFVRSLRSYNLIVFLMVITRLLELTFYGVDGMRNFLIICRLVHVVLAIWLFPLACKGVRTWESA